MQYSKEYIENLYINKRKSAKEIANILNYSENKVRYWLYKHAIPIRSRAQANYYKYNPVGDPYKIKNQLSLEENKLLSIALGLYWGEGHKKAINGVRITNSDPNLLRHWCKFLRSICQVKEEKIKFYLQTFKDNDVFSARQYWCQHLTIAPERIKISNPINSQGEGTYQHISKNGVMTIGVYNTHFLAWMMEQLHNLGYNPDY